MSKMIAGACNDQTLLSGVVQKDGRLFVERTDQSAVKVWSGELVLSAEMTLR